MRGSARIYDVRMVQFVLKIEKLSQIMGPRASQDLRSPCLIIAPVISLHVRAVEFVMLVKPIGISTNVLMTEYYGTFSTSIHPKFLGQIQSTKL